MIDMVSASGLASLLSASSNARALTRSIGARSARTVMPSADVAAGANDQALRRRDRRFEDALAGLGTTDKTISDALKGLREVRQMLTQARALVAEGRASLARGTVETVTNTITNTVTNNALRVDTTTNERLRVDTTTNERLRIDTTTNERLRIDTTTNENLQVDTVTESSTTTPTVSFALSFSGERLVDGLSGEDATESTTIASLPGPHNNGTMSIQVGNGAVRTLTVGSSTTIGDLIDFVTDGDDGTTASIDDGVLTIENDTGASIRLTDAGGRTLWSDMGFNVDFDYRPQATVTTSTSTSSNTSTGTPSQTSWTTVQGTATQVSSTTATGSSALLSSTTVQGQSTLVGSSTITGETVTTSTMTTGAPVETARTQSEREGAFDRGGFAAEFNRLVSAIDSALMTSAVLQGASYRMSDMTGESSREILTTALSSERLGLRGIASAITTGELDRMSETIKAAESSIDAATRRFQAEGEMAALVRGALEGGLRLTRPGDPAGASNELARMLSGLMGSISTGSATSMLRGMRLA